jgi:peptidoglycan-associated lipoprotein
MKNVIRSLAVGIVACSVGACASKKPAEAPVPALEQAAPAAATPAPVAPAPVAIPEPAAAAPALSLDTVYFDFDSYALNETAQASLRAMAASLKANASLKIQVEGHCDERGSNEYNLALGERRSRAVKDFLVGEGVTAAAISTISYGEEKPASQGTGEEAMAKNRRAEFMKP